MAVYLILLLFTSRIVPQAAVLLPIDAGDRYSVAGLRITNIGEFGLVRMARPGIPAHLHTGLDIRRPGNNYADEPIYAISAGVVISKRTDGPYAQLIVEHDQEGERFWTVYEHIAGIAVDLGDRVDPQKTLARFMNREELNRHGWQFDHFHFEILRQMPLKLRRDPTKPDRRFASYTLSCRSAAELQKYFVDPLEFFRARLK